ncbi:hypothetical protein [Cupriavidus sp. BIC8F]|uniref:hypothetical protein n=1 Tax=Cupriavidus sp. BIC8F TaxID=3079014 RepID=UPI002916AA53|nr:hypothetical protein [Cupriavidus sp. BIC8F]
MTEAFVIAGFALSVVGFGLMALPAKLRAPVDRMVLRAMPEGWLIRYSRWSQIDGEPMNLEAEELVRRDDMSASKEGA